MNEHTVKERPNQCCVLGLNSCEVWTVFMEWITLHKVKLSNGSASQGDISEDLLDGWTVCALAMWIKDERVIEWGLSNDNPPWLEYVQWEALVWVLVSLGDLSRWKWYCVTESHHLGKHLGDVMTRKRQYMPQRALFKTKMSVTSYGASMIPSTFRAC